MLSLFASLITPYSVRTVTRGLGPVLAAVAAITGSSALVFAQEDQNVKGPKDHPMISRIEGSTIEAFQQKEFDEYRLVKGPVSGYAPDGHHWKEPEEALDGKNSTRLEGRVWQLTYRIPENRSTLEIARSYEAGLTKAGFKTFYQCSGMECAGSLPTVPSRAGTRYVTRVHAATLADLLMKRAKFKVYGNVYEDQRYLAARLERPEGDIYVSVLALNIKTPVARVDVVEVKPMGSPTSVRR
jgi:OmpA-OmpF porin, OOP family